jgi:hypothetical protein
MVEGELGLVVSDRKSLPGWRAYPFNKQGRFHLSTVERRYERPSDQMTGVLQSPWFVIRGQRMTFLVGGGDSATTYVALVDKDGEELLRAGGTNGPVMRRVNWDVSRLIGKTVAVRVVDRKQRVWAHITFDDFSADAELVDVQSRP